MGRANRPVRTLISADVRPGDVVLVRRPRVATSRWLLVDRVLGGDAPTTATTWLGCWAFGDDAGRGTLVRVDDASYTVKDPRDAQRDRERLNALRRHAQV